MEYPVTYIQIIALISLEPTKSYHHSGTCSCPPLLRKQYISYVLPKTYNGTFLPVEHPTLVGFGKLLLTMKALLRKVVGAHVLRTDEMQTLLLEASAIHNSRPLAPWTPNLLME